jgi:hypothetical protein
LILLDFRGGFTRRLTPPLALFSSIDYRINKRMWQISEHQDIQKTCRKLPQPVVKKYELWKNVVVVHGPSKLREFPGFHDDNEQFTVSVREITPHKY